MPPDDPAAVARACYQAYVDNDRAALEMLIAADFHFTSPLDNRLDRAAYFARCWPNGREIAGFTFVRVAAVGNEVFVTYVGETRGGKRFRNTEVLTNQPARQPARPRRVKWKSAAISISSAARSLST